MSVADVAQSLFADCQSDEEEYEFALHLMAQGHEAGFSDEEVEAASWWAKKIEGKRVKALLDAKPIGTTFTLSHGVGSAYRATYEKTEIGHWDQVSSPVKPLVVNMEAEHLGFCVGYAAIVRAL